MGFERSVLVLHEGWGRTDDIASVARRFERRGFGVVAPDLFGGLPPVRALGTVVRQLRASAGPMFDIVRRELDRLESTPSVVLGLSLGAAIVLRSPTNVPIVAAYGHVPRQIAATGPILGVFGRADRPLRPSGRRLERCSAADVRWFDGAGHSFLVDSSVGLPVWIPGGGPHPSAADAWPMIEDFVDSHTVRLGR